MKFSEFMEKLATGDMIENQITVFFLVIVAAIVLFAFIGKALSPKNPQKPIRMDKKPQKNWKSFCRTKKI